MITEFLLNGIFGGINALLGLMPDYVLPENTDGDKYSIGSYAAYANSVFPLATLVQITGLAIGLRALLQGWELIVWIYHQFWGSAS